MTTLNVVASIGHIKNFVGFGRLLYNRSSTLLSYLENECHICMWQCVLQIFFSYSGLFAVHEPQNDKKRKRSKQCNNTGKSIHQSSWIWRDTDCFSFGFLPKLSNRWLSIVQSWFCLKIPDVAPAISVIVVYRKPIWFRRWEEKKIGNCYEINFHWWLVFDELLFLHH